MTLDCQKTNLSSGSNGDAVKEMQTLLQKQGFYTGYKLDGNFGKYTKQAVIAFQKKHSLSADGVFGPVTCKKLQSLGKTTTTTTGKDGAVFDCPKTSLSKGSKETDKVKILQKYLNEWGYYNKTIDGDFGDITQQAVIDFQKEVGVKDDGIFGPETCKLFVKKTKNELEERNPNPYVIGAKVLEIPPHARTIHSTVTLFPEVVVEEEVEVEVETETVADTNTTDTDSDSDSDTSDTTAQTTTTTKTKTKISRYKVKQLGATVNGGGLNCTGIKLLNGSKGQLVTTLQTGLKKMGYYNSTIDGEFGPVTETAVKKLQADSGITQDGIVGSETCPYFNKKLGIDTKKIADSKKNYVIKDIINPQPNSDNDGLTHDCTLRTIYTREKLTKMQLMQRAKLELIQDEDVIYTLDGYINDLKVIQENNLFMIEFSITGYSIFLEQELPSYSGNKKQSDHLKDICKEIGLFLKLELNGLKDENIELNKVTVQSSGGTGGTPGQTVQMNNVDCNPSNRTESDTWADHRCRPPRCTEKSKIMRGNSNRQYAKDTASHNSSSKELVEYVQSKISYEYVNGYPYGDNPFGRSHCPENIWTTHHKGNCADLARMLKCILDVNGYKSIICHIPGHFYNAIWENGQWTVCDLCRVLYKDSAYGNANHGNQKPLGTWDKPVERVWYGGS